MILCAAVSEITATTGVQFAKTFRMMIKVIATTAATARTAMTNSDSLPSPPTPVEALQQAIAESSRALELVSITGHEFNVKFERLLLAALELALADAELQAHDYAGSITVPVLDALEKNRLHDEWLAEKFRIEQLVQEARAKLYEALQQ